MSNRIYSNLLSTQAGRAWQSFGIERFSGVVAPVPFIYTESSVGCGEIPDQIELLKFCKTTGIKAIMNLPTNPVGYGGSPYASEDPCALEPMLCAPTKVVDEGLDLEQFQGDISSLQRQYPTGTGRINYAVRPGKIDLLWQIFKSLKGHESPGFHTFVTHFKDKWLKDYALYTAIKEKQDDSSKSWKLWPSPLRDRDDVELASFERNNTERITFFAWIQYQLYMQQRKVREFADSIGRKVIGDLPVFPMDDSTGPWAHRHLFKMDLRAGAPPDPYAAKGQRWGQHPYNWEAIISEKGQYLRTQQEYFQRLFHGRRYDHSIGVPRIWSIPEDADPELHGLPGYYDPDPEFREQAAKVRYNMVLGFAPQLAPFFEDLGKIPCMEEDLFDWEKFCERLGAVCMDVAFWKKEWKDDPSSFIPANRFRRMAMSTLGPHDMELADEYYEKILGTVDLELFRRTCAENNINFDSIRNELFDESTSTEKRLRWKPNLQKAEIVRSLMKIPGTVLNDKSLTGFITMYRATFDEQRRFWQLIGMEGEPLEDVVSSDFVRKALEYTSSATSFANFELLPLLMKLDPTIYGSRRPRINIPGTKDGNWEEASPVSMEELQTNQVLIDKLTEIYKGSDRFVE